MTRHLRAAAFLDRDGVLNVDVGYPHRPEDLRLTPTAAEGVRMLNEAGCLTIVVTNQSGVARGLFGLDDVHQFNALLGEALAKSGAHIDAFYICPYHKDATVPEFAVDHPDRKPNPGMILRALSEWPISRAQSVMFGDKESDMEAARRAGVSGVLLESNVGDLGGAARRWLAGRGRSAGA